MYARIRSGWGRVLRRSKFKVQQPLISRILSGHRQEHIRRDRETMHA